jgi:anti-sigma factor RsiW
MCDTSKRLIVWLDGELSGDEAASVKQHVRSCAECRDRLGQYKKISGWVDGYCNAAMASKVNRSRLPRWASVVSVSATAAVIAAFVLIILHKPAEQAPAELSQSTATATVGPSAPAGLLEAAHVPRRKKIRRHPGIAQPQEQRQTARWSSAEPVIRIALPAEAMFAPGAVPQGVNFIADLSIAADGSVQQFRLRP